MINRPIIQFQNVSKRFTFNRAKPHHFLASLFSILRRNTTTREDLWAVRDVSFSVQKGESLGLVGHNGSGKSTLLKLATRILRPTSGTLHMQGRVSALLELGAGFHEDLTGRENIYLNGSVLGLSKQEIAKRFTTIVDFSELHDFIDMPVKHYSSGMYMRLGFSVAVHCDPDILLVDEILAVGDSAFQGKCIDRIYALKRQGVTIIMVSHHLQTLQKLCDRVVWMDHGVMQAQGPTDEILPQYVAQMNSRIVAQRNGANAFHRAGTYEAEITDVRFLDDQNKVRTTFQTGEALTIEMSYIAHRPIQDPEMGFGIHRDDDLHVNGIDNRMAGYEIDLIDGVGKLRYHIKRLPLLPGSYLVSAAIQDGHQPQAYDFHDRAYRLDIEPGGTQQIHGVFSLDASWDWQPEMENESVGEILKPSLNII